MKNKIINFLFKKRIKILKSKRGFTLMEVLVAVGIIAIISAIAVPQMTANKKRAAVVVGDTSISNIMRAYNQCVALNSADQCKSLEQLEVTCPDCESKHTTANGFCAHIKKKVGDEHFAACVQIKGSRITRSYGGGLISDKKICHKTVTQSTDGSCKAKPKSALYPMKTCTAPTGSSGEVCAANNPAATTTDCGATWSCDTVANTATAGTCSAQAACQF